MDYSPPGSSVLGILQERTLEWIAMPSSRGSSQPRDQTHVSFFDILFFFFQTHVSYVSCIGRWLFTTSATWEAPFLSSPV